MKKLLSILCLSALLFGGCQQAAPTPAVDSDNDAAEGAAKTSGWEYIEENGVLIVGLDATFAPMGFTDEKGEIIGFDIDLAKEVGKILDMEIKFQPISWDAKEMELSSKRIDCIWNGMSVTPERMEAMELTQPYLNNKIIIMGKNVEDIRSLDEIKTMKIGTQQGSSALDALKELEFYNEIKENITEMPTYDEVLMDMSAGRIEIMVVDEVLGNYKNSLMAEDEKLSTAKVNFGDDLYAIACRKGEKDLVEKIEGAISEAIASGKATEISQKWFGTDLVLPIK